MNVAEKTTGIPGYTYGTGESAKSPISMEEWEQLKKSFVPSIVIPIKPYLARNGHPPEVVERMYEAWWKSVTLQVTLWCQPYIREGDF